RTRSPQEQEKNASEVDHHQNHHEDGQAGTHASSPSLSSTDSICSSRIGISAMREKVGWCFLRQAQIQMPMKIAMKATVITPTICPQIGFMASLPQWRPRFWRTP